MKLTRFEDLKVWQLAHKLSIDVATLVKSFPKEEKYDLTGQMRRSARSIPSDPPCVIRCIMHYVYVLKSKKDGNFYVGCTNDLRKRFESHNKGDVPSTKFRKPFDLIYYEASSNKEDALKREKYLKTTYGHRYIRNRVRHYLGLSS